MRWIVAHQKDHNIQFVIPLGDLTNRNTPEQWAVVQKAFHMLDGVVPYALVTGNHDYGHDGDTSSRDSGLNQVFPVSDWTKRPTFGGLYDPERLDNTYHLFSAGGKDWLDHVRATARDHDRAVALLRTTAMLDMAPAP